MSATFKLIIGAVVAYLLIGAFSLSMQQESLNGAQGEVWNQTDRSVQVLGRLEQQVTVFMADRKDVIDQITAARSALVAASQQRDLAKLEQAKQLTESVLKLIVEAYPNLSLTEQQTSLMDETAGSLNRITYARQKLIDAQVGFNKTRIFFFPLQVAYARVDVVGENFDPTTQLPPSNFGTPAPAQ